MPIEVELPDGRVLEFPDGTNPAVIQATVKKVLGVPSESTTMGELVRGGKQLASSVRTGVGSITAPEEAARAGVERGEKISAEAGEGPSFAAVRKAYEERGLLPAVGEAVSQIPRALAGQGAQLATMAGGARLGATAGTAVAPFLGPAAPLAPVVGGVLGAGATLLPQFMGANVERQAREQLERGEPISIDRTKAYGAAAGQAALEGAGTAFTLGKRVVKGVLGIADDAALATAKAQQELAKAAARSVAVSAGRGALRGTAEIPVEVAQAVLERAQAGLDLTSPEALSEYGENAYLAGLVGPTIGGAAGVIERRAAKVPPPGAQPQPFGALPAPGAPTPIDVAVAQQAAAAPPPAPPVEPTPPEGMAPEGAPPVAETPAPPPIEEPKVRKPGEPPAGGMQPADIEALGISKKQPIYRRMLGKDLENPEQRAAVLADVENYLTKGNGSEESRTKLTEFKAKFAEPVAPPVEAAEPTAVVPPETPSVVPTEPEAGGAGAPVVSEPSAGPPTEGVGAVEPIGVVPPVADVGKPVGGEGAAPAAVTPAPAPAEPAPAKPAPVEIARGEYEPPVKAGLKPEREQQLREKLAQQRKELAVLETARDKAEGNIYLAEITGNEEAKARAIDAHEAARLVLKKATSAADRTYAQIFDMEQADFEGSVGEAYVAELRAEQEAKGKAARGKTPDTTKWPYTLTTAEAVREDVEFELPHSTPEYKAYIEKFFTPSRKLRKGVTEEDAVREGRELLNRFVLVKARSTTGAASEELTTASRNGDTLGALQTIRKMEAATPFDKLVSQRFESLGRYVGLPKIEIVPADQVKGDAQYDSGRDVVQIAEGQVDTHTVQHEVAHAFVHKLIVANESGKRNDFGYRQLKKLFDHVKDNHPELADEYGMKSVSEFASEAMSNPEFQRALHKIKYQARTVWEAFAQAVRNLLNLAPGQSTALVEAAASVDSLLRAGREYQTREAGGAGVVSVGRVTPGSEAAAQGVGVIGEQEAAKPISGNPAIKARIRVANNMAGLMDAFTKWYGGDIRTAMGRLNPMTLISRALDSDRISVEAQLIGGLKKLDGLIVASELTDANGDPVLGADGKPLSYKNVVARIADAAKKAKKSYAEYLKIVDTVLYGHREFNVRKNNELIEQQAQALEAAGKKAEADKLREEIATLAIKDPKKLDQLEAEFQKDDFIKGISNDLDTIRFNFIDMLVDTGRISKEVAQEWKDNEGYIPFKRVQDYTEAFDEAGSSRRGVGATRNIKKFKGSGRMSTSVVENFSNLLDWATGEAMRNEARTRALQDMTLMGAAKLGGKPDFDAPGGVQDTFENGVRKSYYVPDPMLMVGFGMQPYEMSGLTKALNKYGTRVLRAGVTTMPPFAIKQVFDDISRAYAFAGVKNNVELTKNILFNFPKNWVNEAFKTELFKTTKGQTNVKDLRKLGIVATFDLSREGNIKDVMVEAGAKKDTLFNTILRVMEAGAKASDLSVRQAIYSQVLKETGSTAKAESAAREIINFSYQGAMKEVRFIASVVPFFNAYAQGMDKLAAAAAGKVVGQTTGTARSMFYTRMTYLTAMGLAYALMMQDDEEYNKLPDHVRDTHWIIPGAKINGQPVGIPTAPDLAFFFKAIPERVVRYFKYQGTEEERAAVDLASEMFVRGYDVFSPPNATPQFIRPVLENSINYSFFLGRPLESQAQLRMRPFQRYGVGTSDAMKTVAEWLETSANATGIDAFAVSPIKLENAVRGLLGTAGGIALSMADMMINPDRTDRPLHQQLSSQLTGASAVLKNPVGTKYMDEIYSLEKKSEQVYTTYNRLKENDPDKADKFLDDNIGMYEIRGAVQSVMKQIRNLNKMAMDIDKDTSMSPEERRKEIDELRVEQNEIARVVFSLRKEARDIQMGL